MPSKRLDAVDRGDRQWDLIGPERAIGCSVYPAAEIAEPGVIKHTYGNKFALGEPSGATEGRIEEISRDARGRRLRGPDPRRHPLGDLAQALGQPLLQPDLGADPGDPRRGRHRSRQPGASPRP